jgi:glutamate-5-semialdehyde dehydrogenase
MNAATAATAARPDAIEDLMNDIGAAARRAAAALAVADTQAKNRALIVAAQALREATVELIAANERDVAAAREKGQSGPLIDRLVLNDARIEGMARGLEAVAALPDPVGREIARWSVPSGLDIARVAVPLGVIGIIYESRPNVTADAGALCLKSGNAAILRGGSESFHSSRAIVACLHKGLEAAGLPADAVQLVPTTDRAAVGAMLAMTRWIDIIVPRGGPSLVERVQRESKVPVIAHLMGLNHTYVDASADPAMAREIVVNAKLRRTSVCGATETVLLDAALPKATRRAILTALLDAGCEVRGDAAAAALDSRVVAASETDFDTEYLDAIISAATVEGVEGAIAFIGCHGSSHTDAIIAQDADVAERFLARVDSAIVLWNASTQFADGGEFGMGAEIGISTNRLHARGPVGLEQLATFKYVVRGSGQTRP